MIYSSICLIIILFIANIWDLEYHKIPNCLIYIGFTIGFVSPWTMCSYKEKIFSIILIFFIGMLKLMGMGDIKLWTVMAMYIGLIKSCYVMGLAAFLLILHQLIRNRKETLKILSLTVKEIFFTRKLHFFEQKSYPFSPYIYTSFFTLAILGVI